jgi:hypothetical protein
MPCQGFMTIDARIVGFAASHFNGDYVGCAVVMGATGVRVEIDSVHVNFRIGIRHKSISIVADS